MILKSLHLKNIRSYLDENITFYQGSQLLSGDIGSGKTTILIALEFALFGILRSVLPGEALLRHGSKEGSVTLHFHLNNKDIQICRTLKRVKDRVVQGPGFMMVDGVKQDLTVIELRARILDLLGYPKSLLTKSKSLIYRYTVYTPQDQMKKILFEDKDTRLDTLRKVFDIEKYKRVRENAAVVARGLRLEIKRCEGIIHDLPQKQERGVQLKNQLEEGAKKVQEISAKERTILLKVNQQTKDLEVLEQKTKQFYELRKRFQVVVNNHNSVSENLKYFAQEQTRLKCECELLQKEISPQTDSRGSLQGVQTALAEKEQALRGSIKRLSEFQVRKQSSEELKGKVRALQNCPVCLQVVSNDHKTKIFIIEDKKTEIYQHNLL